MNIATLTEEAEINQQKGLPQEIKSKSYTPIREAAAEANLVNDLETFGLIDGYKYIELNNRKQGI